MRYKVKCDYCGDDAKLVTGVVIYPHRPDLADNYFWMCNPCEAFVGTHENSHKHHFPLGRLANKELRDWKKKTHLAFDPIWKEGRMSRAQAYKWLSDSLHLSLNKTHIGMFDVGQCKSAIRVCELSWD